MSLSDNRTDVFKFGDGYSVTIDWLVETIMQKIAGIDVSIRYALEQVANVKHCIVNAEKVSHVLGFKTGIDLEDGLQKL